MSARVFGIYILFFLLKTLIKNGGAGNIWENLSDSFTQVQRLRLRRQISSGNEQRQDYKPPPARLLTFSQSFSQTETELIPR